MSLVCIYIIYKNDTAIKDKLHSQLQEIYRIYSFLLIVVITQYYQL
jgi:hypothetical protein